jgi:hypothetical protein
MSCLTYLEFFHGIWNLDFYFPNMQINRNIFRGYSLLKTFGQIELSLAGQIELNLDRVIIWVCIQLSRNQPTYLL